MPDLADLLQTAFGSHRAGDLAVAERLYRQILSVDPKHVNALQLLGAVCHQAGRYAEAVEHLTRALQFQPALAEAHFNLGTSLRELGRLPEAIQSFQRAVALQPAMVQAHFNLGNAFRDRKQLEDAAAAYRTALRHQPGYVRALANLGTTLLDLGRLDEALATLQQAAALQPANARILTNLGDACRRLGRVTEAHAALDRALQLDPHNAEAFHSRGLVFLDQQQPQEALLGLRRATEIKPSYAKAHYNLGVVLLRLQRTEEAQACFAEAFRQDPTLGEAPGASSQTMPPPETLGAEAVADAPAIEHFLCGNAWRQLGRLEEAAAEFRRAVARAPRYAEALNNLGVTCRERGALDEAVAALRRAVEVRPGYARAHCNLGAAYQDLRRHAEAQAAYESALQLDPSLAAAHQGLAALHLDLDQPESAAAHLLDVVALEPHNVSARVSLGQILRKLGHFDDARAAFHRVLEADPENVDALNGLGSLCRDHEELDAAVRFYQRAAVAAPDKADAHRHLGWVYLETNRPADAIACFQTADRHEPRSARIQQGLGTALLELGRFDEALAHFRAGLQLDPQCAGARLGLALWSLMMGDFATGWAEYEWRWKCKGLTPRAFSQPLWRGEPRPGQTILLHAEQGLGDTLQFIRFAPEVQARSEANVVVECAAGLVPLLGRTPGCERLVAAGTALPPFDAHAPLMSLPWILGTRLETVPAQVPYIFAAEQRVARWRERLAAIPGFKIGIAWQGKPTHRRDRGRSAPLRFFEALARVPGVQLISLQRGSGVEQLPTVADRFSVLTLGDEVDADGAFVDTAAIMHNLDLVVSTDTAIPHLGGALGVQTWLILSHVAEWRWLRDRSDSPWYPTMRLFRQPAADDWEGAFAAAAAALRPKVQSNRGAVRLRSERSDEAQARVAAAEASRRDLQRGDASTPSPTAAMRPETLCAESAPDAEARGNFLRGNMWRKLGRLDEAAAAYRLAASRAPHYTEALSNLGVTCRELGLLDEALAVLLRAVALRPDYAHAHCNLGWLYLDRNQPADALRSFQTAERHDPRSARIQLGLGASLFELGQFSEAIACYRAAVQLDPECAGARLGLALWSLMMGDFLVGWAEYEWRWKCTGFTPRTFSQPLWRSEPRPGQTILLHAEQGLGDTLQFVRFAPEVQARSGARVVVECAAGLIPLLGRTPGCERLVAAGTALPPFDAHAALMSLPWILGTRLETVPAQVPYIFVAAERAARWRERLAAVPGFKIGIAWQGKPNQRRDRRRSAPLRFFEALARLPGVQLISLQRGFGVEQLQTVADRFSVLTLGDEVDADGAFIDTAAIMPNLDLVVSTDTAIPHLAGALGVPTWLMLSHVAEWRWLRDRSDSPWYPTMRLFRQPAADDWEGAFAAAATALAEMRGT